MSEIITDEDSDPLPLLHDERSWNDCKWGIHDLDYTALIQGYLTEQSQEDAMFDEYYRRQAVSQRKKAEYDYNQVSQGAIIAPPIMARRGMSRVLAKLRRGSATHSV